MAEALTLPPPKDHLPFPRAVHMSMLTGVNVALFWPGLWRERLILQAGAALYGWSLSHPPPLYPIEYYALWRCVEAANPTANTPYADAQCFLADLIEEYYGPCDPAWTVLAERMPNAAD